MSAHECVQMSEVKLQVPLDMDTGTQTQVLSKSSMCS